MCGILVAQKKEIDLEKGLYKIEHRGPDSTRTIFKNDMVFMFNRLAIMGLSESGMQPFCFEDNILVCNGEIYNYNEIKSELRYNSWKSESDCEVLLPLYKEIGLQLFSALDAEFALVMYDSSLDKIIAGRDPLGIRPLFYGYSKKTKKIIFASEMKAIIDFVEQVNPFPPGHYYIDDRFIKFTDILNFDTYSKHNLDAVIINIREKLEKAVIKRLDSDASMGFLLSGGLDSSLVCSIASKHSDKKIKTFSIGMEKDAIDLKYAKQVADYLGTEHEEIIISKKDVLETLDELIYHLETYDITTIRAGMGMYLVCKYIHSNTDIKVLHTGEVSDELFGYKYTDFAPDEHEFQKECIKRIDEIYMYDVLRADRTLAAHSLEARVPFGDIDFVSYIMRIDPNIKMNKYNMGKYLLRKAFEGDYLPQNILYRDKAAFSDAVGHSLVDILKEYSETRYSDNEFEYKRNKYAFIKPFTKEALLYMEIFNKYYPNHSHAIKDYWMPNKQWKGCNVIDPSARVLSNYGKSGE